MDKRLKNKINQPLIYNLIIFICSCVIALYFIVRNLIFNVQDVDQIFKTFLSFCTKAGFLSLILLIFLVSLNISWKYFLKLTIGVASYHIFSYLIISTGNLNNENFYIYNFIENQFFQSIGLKSIFIILSLSAIIYFIINRFLKTFLKEWKQLSERYENISLGIILTLLPNTNNKVSTFYQTSVQTFISDNQFFSFFKQTTTIAFLLTILFSIIGILFIHSLRQLRFLNVGFTSAFITSLIFSIVLNFILQAGIKANSDFMGIYYFEGALFYQILFFTLLFLLVFTIVNNYLIGVLIDIVAVIGFGVANYLKFKMRSEPLLITDFAWLKDLKLVFSFLDLKYIIYSLILIVLPILVFFLFRKRFFNIKVFKNIFFRVGVLFSILLTFYTLTLIFKNEIKGKIQDNIPVVSKLNNKLDIAYMGHLTNARYKSVAYVWTKQISKPIMEKPDNYSKNEVQRIVKKYTRRAAEINSTRDNNLSDQTVIFVLSESFSDPDRIPGVTISKEILPNITNYQNQYTSGIMRSDGYGGGTANMELQSLLGLPYHNLSSAVSVMNTEMVPKMKYLPSISNFYENSNKIAIHLGDSHTYSRKDVYNRLGFEKFIASEGTDFQPSVSQKIGLYPSDESTYQNVLDNLDPNRSQFFSVITFQNHVPWSQGEPADITATGKNFSTEQLNSLNSYVKLIYATDQQTKIFFDKLNNIDKNITVVFYGDHLPSFYPDKIFKENPNLKFETDFFIWNNYKVEKESISKINSSDFSALLLKDTNSKVTPYYALLTDVLEKNNTDKNINDQKVNEINNDLKIIQYDLISRQHYLDDFNNFFMLNNK